MKQLFTKLTIIFTLVFLGLGQITAQVPYQRIDSMVDFNWDGPGQYTKSERILLKYDNLQRADTFERWRFSSLGNSWYPTDILTFRYNAKGLMVESNETVDGYRTITEYYSFDSIKSFTAYDRNVSNLWDPEDSTTYTYYPNNTLQEIINWDWDRSSLSWELDNKYIFNYAYPGNDYVRSRFNYSNNNWELRDSTRYYFNTADQPTLELTNRLSSSTWVQDSTVYNYNSQGQLSKVYEANNTPSVLDLRVEYSYHPNGDLAEELFYEWKFSSREWVKDYVRKTNFDPNTEIFTDTIFDFVFGNRIEPTWNRFHKNDSRYKSTDLDLHYEPFFIGGGYYDDFYGKKEYMVYNIDVNRNPLTRDSTHYYYSNAPTVGISEPIVKNAISISPNPASNKLQIGLESSSLLPGPVIIRDMQGRVVKQGVWIPRQGIDIKELPTGIYTVELFQGAKKYVKRVVKR